MTFTSYAGNLEDVLLWRVLHDIEQGFYVDIGAGDPLRGSVTRALYERGWRGINVEPGHAHQAALRRARPADINLQVAAGAAPGDVLYYETDSGAASADEARATRLATQGGRVRLRPTPVDTLARLCEQHVAGPLHLLRIATGGSEGAVAAGMDWLRWRPWLVLLRHHGRAPLAALAGAGYRLAFDDGLNHYYVADEQAGLVARLAQPANAGDGFVLCEDHPFAHPLDALRQQAADAREDAAAAASRLQETMEWVEARRREHEETAARLVHATSQLAVRDQAVSELNEQLGSQEALVRQRDTQLQTMTEQLYENAQWAAHVDATLHATYASLSWRITRPLRSANHLAQRVVRRLRRVPGQVRRHGLRLALAPLRAGLRLARGLARRAAKAGVAYVVARPRLSYHLRSTLARSPRLVALLRTVMLRVKDQPATAATAAVAALADTSAMPAPARQALDHLRRAVRGPRNL